MKNKKIFASLLILPLLLTGCGTDNEIEKKFD